MSASLKWSRQRFNMEKYKYPRTYHLPYSPTVTDDDKRLSSDEHFNSFDEVVVTIKMDGENCTVYNDGSLHARSIDGGNYPWQSKVKGLVQSWCWNIPSGWRVCGENLQATHSIEYTFDSISQLFQCFGIYNDKNENLSWDELVEYCSKYGICHVPIIYRGKYDKVKILEAFDNYCRIKGEQEVEGFVVRNAGRFHYDDFKSNVGKYVRANHITTDKHWTKTWKNNKVL